MFLEVLCVCFSILTTVVTTKLDNDGGERNLQTNEEWIRQEFAEIKRNNELLHAVIEDMAAKQAKQEMKLKSLEAKLEKCNSKSESTIYSTKEDGDNVHNNTLKKRLLALPTTPLPMATTPLPKTITENPYKQVAFCAELIKGASNLGLQHTVVYDTVILNAGNGYNKNDGIFTAPVEGIYVFSWTSMGEANVYQGTELVLDGAHISYAYSGATNSFETASKTVILALQPGQEVWIRTDTQGGGNALHPYGYNSFVGFLLK